MKPFLTYGLRTGILSGCWLLGSFSIVSWLNSSFFHSGIPATSIRSYAGLFSIVVLFVGIYLGMRQARARNGGILSYGQAVTTGVLIACITAVLVAIFDVLYCTVINPGYADFMVKDTQQALLAAGKAPAEIGRRLAEVRKEFTTGAQVAMALVGQSVLGSIAALILGLFLRTRKTV